MLRSGLGLAGEALPPGHAAPAGVGGALVARCARVGGHVDARRRVPRELARVATLPALAVVLLSLGVLLEDFALVVLALTVGGAGVLIEIVLGKAAVHGIGNLF